MVMLPEYEIYCLKYAERPGRRRDHFLGGDPHDRSMPMDYFIWLLRSGERLILVDTGFDARGAQYGRVLLRQPAAALALIGVEATQLKDIIITHLHNDHAGTFDDFPQACFHLQEMEMAYVTGRHMRHKLLRRPFDIEHVGGLVRLVYQNRVAFHSGDALVAPGVSVHRLGGHTMGLQCVRVHTQRGWVVLASDASHYYEHFEKSRCFPLVYHVGEMIEGFSTIKQLAESIEHIIPGHDPQVLSRYPAASTALQVVVARLDLSPLGL